MKDNPTSRRLFLKGGALMAAPAALSASALVMAAPAASQPSRLADQLSLRELHQAWVRQVNQQQGDARLGTSVRHLSAHDAGAPDRFEVSADGARATGQFDCALQVDSPLAPDSTLAQMAHAQGFGTVRQTQRYALTVHYAKRDGHWTMGHVESRPV